MGITVEIDDPPDDDEVELDEEVEPDDVELDEVEPDEVDPVVLLLPEVDVVAPFRLEIDELFCEVTTVVEFVNVIVEDPLPLTVVQLP